MTEYIEEDMLGIKELFINKGTIKYNKIKIIMLFSIGIVVGSLTYFYTNNDKKIEN